MICLSLEALIVACSEARSSPASTTLISTSPRRTVAVGIRSMPPLERSTAPTTIRATTAATARSANWIG
jgi:hypothetical protein